MSYGSRKRGYNLEPVTNTSSSSCANNGRRTLRWVLDACCRTLRLCFSHFATHTVDNTVDLYAAKPDIRPESRCLLTPPAFDAPVGGSRLNIVTPRGMEKLEWCGYPTVKKIRRYVYSFWHDPRTWETDGRTDRQTDTTRRHRPRLCIAWQKLTNLNEKWRYSLDNSDSIHLIQFVYCLNIFCQQPCKVNICKSAVSAIGFTVEDKRYVKMADD